MEQPTLPRINVDNVNRRIAQLRSYMEKEEYLEQIPNLKTAIRLYEEGKLGRLGYLVSIQEGVVVPREDLQLSGPPFWLEVSFILHV